MTTKLNHNSNTLSGSLGIPVERLEKLHNFAIALLSTLLRSTIRSERVEFILKFISDEDFSLLEKSYVFETIVRALEKSAEIKLMEMMGKVKVDKQIPVSA